MKDRKKIIYNFLILLLGLICCSGFSFLMPFRIYFILIFGFIQFFIMIKNGKIKYIKSKSLFFLLIFCIYTIISLFYSLDRVQTLKFIAVYISITLMIINSYEEEFNFDALKIIETFCKIVSISIIVNMFIPQLFSKYLYFLIDGGASAIPRLNGEINAHIFSGIVGEKGEAAYLMVLAIIISLSNIVPTKNKEPVKKSEYVWLIIYLIALILPAKRMLFAIGILICVFFILFWTNSKKRFWYVILGIIVGILGIFIALKVPALNTLINRFLSYSEDTTGNGRIYLWEKAIEMYNKKPLLGYGYGTYNTYTKYSGVILSSTGEWNAYAHNIYYQMLGEIGIVGVILFTIMLLDTISHSIKLYCFRKKMESKDVKLLFVGISIIMMNIIYGYSGNPIYYTNQVFLFFWGISIILCLRYKYFILKKGV